MERTDSGHPTGSREQSSNLQALTIGELSISRSPGMAYAAIIRGNGVMVKRPAYTLCVASLARVVVKMPAVASGAIGTDSLMSESGGQPCRIRMAQFATVRVVLAVAGRFPGCVASGATGRMQVRG